MMKSYLFQQFYKPPRACTKKCFMVVIRLYQSLDGITNPKYKLLHFLKSIFLQLEKGHKVLTGIGAAI